MAEQWLGMHNIHIYHIVFELCMSEEKKRKKLNKTEIFIFLVFSILRKVSRNHKVDLVIE